MQDNSKVNEFIKLAGGNNTVVRTKLFYFDLVNLYYNTKRSAEQELQLFKYTLHNPEILTMKIGENTIFNYFFDKATKSFNVISMYEFWQATLLSIIDIIQVLPNCDDILGDHTYIYRLQSGIIGHSGLFKYMIINGNFSIGDPDFLVYSVIARGEKEKLHTLSEILELDNIGQFPGIFDVAVKHGRYEIIKYLVEECNIDISQYGKVLEFPHYPDTHKCMFYQNGLYTIDNKDIPILGSKQSYVDTIKYILNDYKYAITIETLQRWASAVRDKYYYWDKINFKDIIEILRPHIKEHIPLSHDFKEFNIDVFGKEWTDRECIIEYCNALEKKYSMLEERYELLYHKLYQTHAHEELFE